MCQVLQTVLAAALVTPQDYNVILSSWDINLNILLVRLNLRPDYLQTAKLGSHCLLKAIGRVVLGVNVSVPAVNRFDVRDSKDITAIVFVFLQIKLALVFWSQIQSRPLEGSRKNLHA